MANASTRFLNWDRLNVALALWLAALCGLAVLSAPGAWFLGVGWSFLVIVFAAPFLVVAGLLLIAGFVSSWRQRQTPLRAVVTALIPPGVVILGFALFFPIIWGVQYVMTCGVLVRNYSRYEHVVRQVAEASRANGGPILDERLSDGTSVYAERGAPNRIIFELTGWNSISQGILYDPTGLGASGPPVGEESLGPCLPITATY